MIASAGPKNFALLGAAGYIAPRHLNAIRETGHCLVAACDSNDSVGVLDRYFPETRFFTEIERFDRYLEKLRRHTEEQPVEYLSVCTPNYLHDAHVRLAFRLHANAICEKPLVISPWNLDQLIDLEEEYQRKVFTVLQLRLHPAVKALKEALEAETTHRHREISLTYVTARGPWYKASWKGSEEKSGGIAMNIGVHFFDMLLWLFGSVHRSSVHIANGVRLGGLLELERATIRWYLSVDRNDLPDDVRESGGSAYRALTIDGEDVDFSTGFTDLHTEVYRDILSGGGYGIADARPAIELVHTIRTSREVPAGDRAHRLVQARV